MSFIEASTFRMSPRAQALHSTVPAESHITRSLQNPQNSTGRYNAHGVGDSQTLTPSPPSIKSKIFTGRRSGDQRRPEIPPPRRSPRRPSPARPRPIGLRREPTGTAASPTQPEETPPPRQTHSRPRPVPVEFCTAARLRGPLRAAASPSPPRAVPRVRRGRRPPAARRAAPVCRPAAAAPAGGT